MRDGWSALELRYLATLAAVGREASFSKAAESLGYTQSAVSQQISRLELLTGTRLVDRPMIASENFAPVSVMAAQGSVLTNKYAEGYPGGGTTAAASTST